MELQAVNLSESALRGIGTVIIPRQRLSVPAGTEFLYSETNGGLGLEGPLSSGSMECAPRQKKLSRLECHLKTPELLVALDGDAVVCVAPPQEPANGTLKGLTAVKMRAGESIIVQKGAWHWIPYPEGARPVRFLVVFRAATGKDDLNYCDLAEPLSVVS